MRADSLRQHERGARSLDWRPERIIVEISTAASRDPWCRRRSDASSTSARDGRQTTRSVISFARMASPQHLEGVSLSEHFGAGERGESASVGVPKRCLSTNVSAVWFRRAVAL